MNGPAINLIFRYSERDHARAMRAHYADQLRLWLDISVIVVVGMAGIWLWPSFASQSISRCFRLLCPCALCRLRHHPPDGVSPREPKFRDEYSLTFSADGIHFQTAHIDSNLEWNLYSRALIDTYSYLLYQGSRTFTVIPKRVFQNIQQQEAFDQLVTQHVPVIVRKQ